ncbi:TauD/TfdA family dioxygenase [Pseudomonas shahriarae]|uniref:TauD/TfdA family dioxygenase n=1 Tax=Pseudomonas shahriarae TaxID=2745512 RepID=UPI00236268C4|nr:TauD/TfdA family dioxygenase [Pseudomonas shahriarae]MDD0979773.1 TauD/TfdA family dioxygenase [Pseudomonas shahriarae]
MAINLDGRAASEILLVFEEVAQFGFSKFSVRDASVSTVEIASWLGVVANLPGISKVQELTPKLQINTNESTYSGNYGLGVFPFHTDMAHWNSPPRFFILRCICPAPDVKTLLLDFKPIIESIDEVTLARALFRPRRSLEGQVSILKICEKGLFRWDSLFLSEVNNVARELKKEILENIVNSKPSEIALLSQAECLIIDNWRMLHGRTEVLDQSKDRILERVYLESSK